MTPEEQKIMDDRRSGKTYGISFRTLAESKSLIIQELESGGSYGSMIRK